MSSRFKTRWLHAVAAWIIGIGASIAPLAPALATPFSIVDDRGVTVTLARAPQRIVSLLPSLTESVCVLEQCQKLVGVDRYSNWPESVKNLPKVGGGLDPNLEAILALRPDLVLVASSAKVAFRLQALGVPVAALEPKTMPEMRVAFGKLGVLLGVTDADRRWQALERQVDQVLATTPKPATPVKVYFEASQGPYGASESSFIGQLLARFGAHNILPGQLGPFPKINPEFVVIANPDLIMADATDLPSLAQRPGWGAIKAVQTRRVCGFTAVQGDILVRAGPRIVQAAQLMAECLSGKTLVSDAAPATPQRP